MRTENRHRQIMGQMRGAGRVFVTKLTEHFDVTPETIRRGLTTLDRSGTLCKIHGGVIPAPALPETGVTQREQANPIAKQTIARVALARLAPEPGTTLLIGAGITIRPLTRLLPGDSDLTVITNFVLTAAWLADTGRTRVRILGGQLRGLTQAAAGPEAVGALSILRVNVAVLGASDLSAVRGLSTPDPDEATVKRTMVHSTHQVVTLVDSTKIGQEYLVSSASLDDIDPLVTGAELPPTLIDRLTAIETEVLVI